jgi:group I intron endonuclease
MIGIYKIVNSQGKVYVGQSTNINKREKSYKNLRCKNQIKIYNSIKKYGWESHVFSILELCEVSQLNTCERYWQDFYNVLSKKGLNCKLTKSDDKSGFFSEETKNKISKNSKNIPKPGTSENMKGKPSRFKGKKHSEETKQKMSFPKSKEHCENISKGKKNKPNPKLSIFKKNKPSSFKGHNHSEETKLKQSLAKKGKTYEQLYGIEKAKIAKFKKSLPRKGKSIICINTGDIFPSIKEASKYFNISERSIGNILLGYASKTRTGLKFKYAN